jgi:hypothetical protein
MSGEVDVVERGCGGDLSHEMRQQNNHLRAVLAAEQARTAALLPQLSDLHLLRRLVMSSHNKDQWKTSPTAVDGEGDGEEQDGGGGCEELQQAIAVERARAEALKTSLMAIRQEAQHVNVVCVELHAGILSWRL